VDDVRVLDERQGAAVLVGELLESLAVALGICRDVDQLELLVCTGAELLVALGYVGGAH